MKKTSCLKKKKNQKQGGSDVQYDRPGYFAPSFFSLPWGIPCNLGMPHQPFVDTDKGGNIDGTEIIGHREHWPHMWISTQQIAGKGE